MCKDLDELYSDTWDRREVFNYYKQAIIESQKYTRATIRDSFGNIVWQEAAEDYEARMQRVREEEYKHFMSCCKSSCFQCQNYANQSYTALRKTQEETLVKP